MTMRYRMQGTCLDLHCAEHAVWCLSTRHDWSPCALRLNLKAMPSSALCLLSLYWKRVHFCKDGTRHAMNKHGVRGVKITFDEHLRRLDWSRLFKRKMIEQSKACGKWDILAPDVLLMLYIVVVFLFFCFHSTLCFLLKLLSQFSANNNKTCQSRHVVCHATQHWW
jgi:hypothetical protein